MKLSKLLSASLISLSLLSPFAIAAEEGPEEETTIEEAATEETNNEEAANTEEANEEDSQELFQIHTNNLLQMPQRFPQQFAYDSGVDIAYPEDGVKGIYVTAHSAGGEKMDELVQIMDETELNSMVIDVKDDYGNIVIDLETDDPVIQDRTISYQDSAELMAKLEEHQIYPIARIVVFKDTVLAEDRPDLSFTQGGSVWKNGNGEAFVNPFEREVWEYNVEIAKKAAELGFKEIQFDYVRFPEGFETFDSSLNYGTGEYEDTSAEATDAPATLDEVAEINQEFNYQERHDNAHPRVQAVTDFVDYAYDELKPYGVDVSVDIFGYTATIPAAEGIGQDFSLISENVDVISSMIYPSHWGPGYFDIPKPDLAPYELVDEYMQDELPLLESLDNPPRTRPWLQDFTASYLGGGNYMTYGPAEVTAQIQALADHGVNEFLLWNAGNDYSTGANFTPEPQARPAEEEAEGAEEESNQEENSEDSTEESSEETSE